ncbi:hypothetical protein P3G55_03090 [Leptospira sp. 96542]|nr:hypothetical protein [Leptospira sp. 96542]
MVRSHLSPYDLSPNQFFSNVSLDDIAVTILSQINHPDWTTIYSPFVLFVFAIFTPSFTTILLKFLYLSLDIFIFHIIKRSYGRKLSILLWLLPIWIKEIHWNLHFEILIVFFIFLTRLSYFKKRIYVSSFLYGLSFHIKLTSVIFCFEIFNIFLKFLKTKKNKVYKCFGLGLFFFLGFGLFFFAFKLYFYDVKISFGITKIIQFTNDFRFNQFFQRTLFLILPGLERIVLLPILITIIFYIYSLKAHKTKVRYKDKTFEYKFYFLFGYSALILIPVQNPWYFLLLLPYLPSARKLFLIPSLILLWIPQVSYITNVRLGLLSDWFYEIPSEIYLWEALLSGFCLIVLFGQRFILLYKISNISNMDSIITYEGDPDGRRAKEPRKTYWKRS